MVVSPIESNYLKSSGVGSSSGIAKACELVTARKPVLLNYAVHYSYLRMRVVEKIDTEITLVMTYAKESSCCACVLGRFPF